MVKSENIVIKNMTGKEFSDRLAKLNTNYKTYKREWSISVKQEKNNFYILASNKKRGIVASRGNCEEFMKKMIIKATEQGNDLLLQKLFKFDLEQFISIRLIPYSSYLLLLVNGLYILLSFLLNKNRYSWASYTELLLAILALTNFIWARNSRKLELERYQIIEELLQRHLH